MLSTSISISTPTQTSTSTPTSIPGAGRLVFERVGPRSVVRSAFAASPLRLLTPRNHGQAAWAYTSSLGGGLVDGDEIRIDVRIGDRAVIEEGILLDPAHGPIAERFGRSEVLCTLLLAGDALAAPRAAIAAELASLPARAHADRIESANLLGDDALLVRMAA